MKRREFITLLGGAGGESAVYRPDPGMEFTFPISA
jgi:hypothetical protein